jgi:hypothetical protein
MSNAKTEAYERYDKVTMSSVFIDTSSKPVP